jgi:hypothetical protein
MENIIPLNILALKYTIWASLKIEACHKKIAKITVV